MSFNLIKSAEFEQLIDQAIQQDLVLAKLMKTYTNVPGAGFTLGYTQGKFVSDYDPSQSALQLAKQLDTQALTFPIDQQKRAVGKVEISDQLDALVDLNAHTLDRMSSELAMARENSIAQLYSSSAITMKASVDLSSDSAQQTILRQLLDIVEMMKIKGLERNDAFIVLPIQASTILLDVKSQQFQQNQIIESGIIGQIGGIRLVESAHLAQDSSKNYIGFFGNGFSWALGQKSYQLSVSEAGENGEHYSLFSILDQYGVGATPYLGSISYKLSSSSK